MSKADRARKQSLSRKRRKDVEAIRVIRASHAGRPRKTGVRQACGDLKPPGPNEVVVEHRRRILGRPAAKGMGLRAAENPLDLMLFRGWLTRHLHDTAHAYRRLYLAAFPALPDMKASQIDEAPSQERAQERHSQAFRTPNPDGNPAAMNMLRAIWRVLESVPGAQAELLEVCLLQGAWPPWLSQMIEGRTPDYDAALSRKAFFRGLHVVGQVLARPSLSALVTA